MNETRNQVSLWALLRPAAVLLAGLSVITGLAYPLLVTGVAQALFPHKANGSLIVADGQVVGSALIGQPFDDPAYFWSRPSATASFPYNAQASGGSNLAASSPALVAQVTARVDALRAADPGSGAPIPIDLVTASGSGLDPDIGLAAAMVQVPRVARARGLPEQAVRDLVTHVAEGRNVGVLGEPRVNVLRLNLALDQLAAQR